jgi:RHS repeat-associated protein
MTTRYVRQPIAGRCGYRSRERQHKARLRYVTGENIYRSRRVLFAIVVFNLALVCHFTSGPSFAQSLADTGFQKTHSYDRQQNASIDLFTLAPIVVQPLTPSLRLSDLLSLEVNAYYTGISWTKDPNQSYFYFSRPPGVTGSGWYFGIPRMFNGVEEWNSTCNVVRELMVSEQGADISMDNSSYTSIDLHYTINGWSPNTVPSPCGGSAFNHYPRNVFTQPEQGDMSFLDDGTLDYLTDRWSNRLTYTYMESADFPSGTPPDDYDYTWNRPHPDFEYGSVPTAPDVLRLPKRITDSMGRYVEFHYGKIPGYSKYLLTEVDVPTPNGRGLYRLYYQMRAIGNSPEGWPPFLGSTTARPFLVTIELPAATSGQSPLTYQYDYNNSGEMSEIRYPSGTRINLGWADIQMRETNGNLAIRRGVVTRDVYNSPNTSPYRWEYTKAWYPVRDFGCYSIPINERERTIVNDPSGNDTEYRFLWGYPSQPMGAVGAIKTYKGRAPRFLNLESCSSGLDQVDPAYVGELVRSQSAFYDGMTSASNGVAKTVYSTATIYYDDPLNGETPSWLNNLSHWAAGQLNAELTFYDPTSMRQGYASWFVHGESLDGVANDPPWGGGSKTTESGNMVGVDRVIEGVYTLPPILKDFSLSPPSVGFYPDQYSIRKVTQGSYVSRTEYGKADLPFTVIQRANPNGGDSAGDVRTLYSVSDYNPSSITKTGGQPPDPNLPGMLAPDDVVNMTYQYGMLKTVRYGTLSWNAVNRNIAPTGQVTTSYDSAGLRTDYTYDDLGRITGVSPTSPELPAYTSYSHGSSTYLDNLGYERIHRYEYGVITTRGSSGSTDYEYEYQVFDGEHKLLKVQRLDASGQYVQQTRVYDGLGAPTFVSEWHAVDDFQPPATPPGTTISYYGPRDWQTDPNSIQYRDPFSRTRKVTTADGAISEISYFGNNSKVTLKGVSTPTGLADSTTKYYRDYQNRLKIVDAPWGSDPNQPESTDAIYSYDHLGNLRKVNLVSQVTFAPYSAGLGASLRTDRFMMDPNSPSSEDGQVRTFAYDNVGRLTAETHPERGSPANPSATYPAYDPAGRVLRMVDTLGTEFRMSYDAAGRRTLLRGKKAAENPNQSFRVLSESIYNNDPNSIVYGAFSTGKKVLDNSYDESEQLVSIHRYRYDAVGGLNGRLNKEEWEFPFWANDPNVSVIFTSTTFTNSGQVRDLVYPAQAGATRTPTKVRHTYAHGHLTSVEWNRQTTNPAEMLPLLSSISYNRGGSPDVIEFVNGVQEDMTSDVRFRPGRISVMKQESTLWDSGLYSYDGSGNIMAIGGQNYRYDLIGRLRSSETSTMTGSAEYGQSYEYDAYGNMTSRDDSSGVVGNQVFSVSSATNRLTVLNPGGTALNYTYDSNGALTNNGVRGFTWDTLGRVREVKTVDMSSTLAEYLYDERDYRISTKTDGANRQTIFVRDGSGLVLSEFSRPSSNISPVWKTDFVYALGRHIALVENTEPDTPTGIFSNSEDGSTTVSLGWLASTASDLYGYDVYRTEYGTSTRTKLTSAPVTATQFPDTGLVTGTRYLYEIVSVDSANNASAPTSIRRIKVGDATAPSSPTGLSGNVLDCESIALSWTVAFEPVEESELAGYNIYRRVLGASTWPSALNGAIPFVGSSYMDTVAFAPSAYQYGLEAVDAAGNNSAKTLLTVSMPEECLALFDTAPDSRDFLGTEHRVIGDGGDVPFRVRYMHVDHLGTPRVLTDAAGNAVSKLALFPFGELVPGSSTSTLTHWFTGHERDFVSGQDYMLSRLHSSMSGRFTSPDSLFPSSPSGMPYSLYSYVGQNPLRFVDPDGRLACDVTRSVTEWMFPGHAEYVTGALCVGLVGTVGIVQVAVGVGTGNPALVYSGSVTLADASYDLAGLAEDGANQRRLDTDVARCLSDKGTATDCALAQRMCDIMGDSKNAGCKMVREKLKRLHGERGQGETPQPTTPPEPKPKK